MTINNALVVGGNGGIGKALLKVLSDTKQYTQVHAVVRTMPEYIIDNVIYHVIGEHTEQSIEVLCVDLSEVSGQFTLAVCALGVLHQSSNQNVRLFPEKRMEDIRQQQLAEYFQVNSIIPALWLKHLEPLLKGLAPAKLVFLSARVGSITDNKLGGWYGYRASKAALNMLVKTAQVELQRRAKNIGLVCYHPGTVDSELSKPFQKNVPTGKLFSAQFSAQCLLQYLPRLHTEQSPHYIDWQGKPIPW